MMRKNEQIPLMCIFLTPIAHFATFHSPYCMYAQVTNCAAAAPSHLGGAMLKATAILFPKQVLPEHGESMDPSSFLSLLFCLKWALSSSFHLCCVEERGIFGETSPSVKLGLW
jgi:hypothetical protein